MNKLYDDDAEQSVLCSIMLDNECLDDVRYKLDIDNFRTKNHRLIYAAMLTLHDRMESIDLVTLSNEMK